MQIRSSNSINNNNGYTARLSCVRYGRCVCFSRPYALAEIAFSRLTDERNEINGIGIILHRVRNALHNFSRSRVIIIIIISPLLYGE